jgi:hypothetical protein
VEEFDVLPPSGRDVDERKLMKDVCISLTFFLLLASMLCGWTYLGYRTLLVALTFNEPGACGAGMVVGAAWGVMFSYMWRWFCLMGRESMREIEKARTKR